MGHPSERQRALTNLLVVAYLIAAVSPALATDFHILLVQQSPAERISDPPVGTVLINGGYEHGLAARQTGILWQDSTLEIGSVAVGTAIVLSTTAEEATCSIVSSKECRFKTLDLRISIDPIPENDALCLEKGEAAFSTGDIERALYYFEKLWWVHQDNPLIRSRTEACRRLVDSAKATGLSETERQQEIDRLDRYVLIAHRYTKLNDHLMAELYLKRLLAIDSTHHKVRALQVVVPDRKSFSTLRTDCYPIPPYNDSSASSFESRTFKVPPDQVPPLTLLGVTCDSSRYALLIDRQGRLSQVFVPVSSGSNQADRIVTRLLAQTELSPLIKDGEPTCSWVNYEVAFHTPPADSLLASYFTNFLTQYTGLESAIVFDIFFFKFLRTPKCGYTSFFPPETDSVAMQRTVDSILYHNWPEAFERKTWKKVKDKPEYFKKWKKDSN